MTAQLEHVKIVTSPDLIKLLGRKLYSNPVQIILLRELIQNSVDASNNTPIDINFSRVKNDDGKLVYYVSCYDKGVGMSKDTLLNVFLSIGSSYKINSNDTGGFGIAKVSIFSCDKFLPGAPNFRGTTMLVAWIIL